MSKIKSYKRFIKNSLVIIVALLIVITFLSVINYKTHINKGRLIIAEENNVADVISNNLYHEIYNSHFDLMFLKSDFEFKMNQEKNTLNLLKEEWKMFSQVMKDYHQIRYIDENGNEVIRINNDDGNAYIVPDVFLQNKADRYYFKESLLLEEGEFYHSKLDLNVENGIIEIPYRPMIRISTPVFDENGDCNGIIIVNYSGQKILDEFNKYKNRSNGEMFLITCEGEWLISNTSASDWSFMDGSNKIGFDRIYADAWAEIVSGETVIKEDDKTFVVHELDFEAASLEIGQNTKVEDYQTWYIVSFIDENNPVQHYLKYNTLHFILEVIKKNIILLLSIVLVYTLVQRLLRTREIEKSKAVYYSTIFNEMLMKSPDYIYLKDINGKYIDMSDALIKLIRRERVDIIGYSNRDIFGEDVQDFFKDHQLKSLTNNLLLSANETNEHYINVMRLPIVDTHDHIMSTLVVGRDVSSQILVENELRKSEDQAIKAKDLQGKFLANMSHEIRAPLNGVMGMLELISKSPLSKDQEENITIANHSALSLLTIVNDILDFSKIEANELTLKSYDFNLRELANELITIFAQQAQKTVKVSVHIDEKVPHIVVGDGVRVRQVLTNLLSNAVKFTEIGEVTLAINTLEHKDDYVDLQFSVHDSGTGISIEDQNTLFNRFSQFEDSDKASVQGTGLGLSISSMLVQLMGSELQFTSVFGIGSNFYFKIRFMLPEEDLNTKNIKEPLIEKPHYSGKTILLIEDELVNQMMIRKYFERMNIEIIVTDSEDEAIEILRSKRMDYIFISITSQKSCKTVDEIRQFDNGNIPIIALKTDSNENIKELCAQFNVDDVLIKPFELVELNKLVVKWCQKTNK